jgi:hypothetical protein
MPAPASAPSTPIGHLLSDLLKAVAVASATDARWRWRSQRLIRSRVTS